MGLHGLPDRARRTYEEESKLDTVCQQTHGSCKCLVSVEKTIKHSGFFELFSLSERHISEIISLHSSEEQTSKPILFQLVWKDPQASVTERRTVARRLLMSELMVLQSLKTMSLKMLISPTKIWTFSTEIIKSSFKTLFILR